MTAGKRLRHQLLVVIGALGLTLAFFLVLPLIQAIGKSSSADRLVTAVDSAVEPPPPEPPEPEKEPEPEKPEDPPEIEPQDELLDLDQLELVLGAGSGSGGWMAANYGLRLEKIVAKDADENTSFGLDELDQRPRAIYQPSPAMTAAMRSKGGSAWVLFIVDRRGKVAGVKVRDASDPIFEKPAAAAVVKWKFEPGKRNGKVVRTRMRVKMTFPKG